MVRIKHRYLLINILYPTPSSTQPKPSNTGSNTGQDNAPLPYTIQFRHPSPDRLFDAKSLQRIIKTNIAELFGDYGAGMIAGSLQVKYCSAATSTAIVRVARAHYRMVWAALTFVTSLTRGGEACTVQVVRVSGTIRKSEEEAVRRARGVVRRVERASRGSANEDDDDGMEGLNMIDGIEDGDEGGENDEED